ASWQDIVHLVPAPRFSEADLDQHLTNTATAKDKPTESLYYLDSKADTELDFAVELVNQTRSTRRREVVAASKPVVAKVRKREEQALVTALGKLGIDWKTGPHAPTQLVASFAVDKPKIVAGDAFTITGTIKNTGKSPAYRVRARAKTDDEALDGAELVFGRIDPGASKTATVQLQTVKSAPSRAHSIQWVFDDANAAHTTAPLQVLATEGVPHPRFAYSYQLVDDSNGDGLVQAGEKLHLHLRVKNVGAGRGIATVASLSSMAGDRVIVNKGRFELAAFEPGQTRDVDFTLEVRSKLDLAKLPVELVIYDSDLREGATEKLELAIRDAVAFGAGSGTVTTSAATLVHAAAAVDAEALGSTKPGATLRVTGRSTNGKWARVELEPGLPGFVPASAVSPATAAPGRPEQFTRRWQSTPPALALTATATRATADHIAIAGAATDDTQVDDVYVTVSNAGAKVERRKVFYLSNRGAKAPGRLDFKAGIPLWPGSNRVTIVARESEKVKAVQALWIYRAP
ncbi:MAG TPA: CARDB domain-containing protein, partial [Kofleriaceae bacterium]